MSNYIITQNKNFFDSSNFECIKIKKSQLKKINKKEKINIFLYDNEKNKLYGTYEIDLNKKTEKDNFLYLNITDTYKKRRGIYYNLEEKYNDFSIYNIDENIFYKLKERLILLNENLSQTFLSCTVEKQNKKDYIFHYKAIETYPSLYIAEYKKPFDFCAYNSIYKEYLRLLKRANSENDNISKYLEIGNYLMNMLIPEKDFREHLFEGFRIVYLNLDETTSSIPWDILSYNNKFLSEKIIFSYISAVNVMHKKITNNKKIAVISIPYDDINDEKEIDLLKKLSVNNNLNIDVYKKEHDYFEFVKILENYDIVHIITHGHSNGLSLNKNYILNNISALENPPKLIFINACNMNDSNIVKSFLSCGVNTVVSGIGSLSDNIYNDFVMSFYSNLLHKHSRINTAQSFHFAHIEIKDNYNGFMRYRFNGVACYV
ncbi:CHAT domain-containing protein [Brachyspira sp. SAP_772]|uniref:CHAT domain-containing protein n=1 Tax=Brachyspira sp. SAP_772 TaxID=2608385 RepID=UPI0012F4E20F|nr:CHAT domain-containing protein [Brachyspira sp. SAP_772]